MAQNERYALTVMLAAGGTGGHIFPAEALAEILLERGYQVVLVTDKRFEAYRDKGDGALSALPIHYIPAASFGGGIFKKIRALIANGRGFLKARCIINKVKPDVVVGFGGYPSFPTMMAAGKRVPSIIHEQNALLGKTNRVLANRVDVLAASFEKMGLVPQGCDAVIHTVGNPVRSPIRALRAIPSPQLQDDGIMQILVTGGSQGASIFGDVVPKAIALLPEQLRRRVRIDQQVREEQLDVLREAYNDVGVHADLATFFSDVPARLAAAHLVIARSGASTVAELTCAGRPAILVPLPTSADDHQKINARAMEDGGGAWLMPQDAFTPEALAARLESFLTLPAGLTRASEQARATGQPEAATILADLVEHVAHGRAHLFGKNDVALQKGDNKNTSTDAA